MTGGGLVADWPTIAVVVALGALLWRQIAALAVTVADVNRRLARLEGWIEGERAGRSRAPEPTPEGERA